MPTFSSLMNILSIPRSTTNGCQPTSQLSLEKSAEMAVTMVRLACDAYLACVNHALSADNEEIMGLLIGEVDVTRVCHISTVILLKRSDKKKDRVEISPEQLSDASTYAERLADSLGRPMRVLGWYHSHPKITVWPSHVDLKTQALYQMMDECFFGIIFSAFNEDRRTKSQNIEISCFQSVDQSPEGEHPQYSRIEVPLVIDPVSDASLENLDQLLASSRGLYEEEQEVFHRVMKGSNDLMCLHNKAVYTKALCKQLAVIGAPMVQLLESKLADQMERLAKLEDVKRELMKKLNL